LPVWHPLLRTASLLRVGQQMAQHLIFLADGLADEEPCTTSPAQVLHLVAADLWQLRAELEIFDEPPRRDRWEAFRITRSHLARIAWEMGHRQTEDEDAMDPLRALAALRIEPTAHATLGRVGAQLATHFEEHAPEPRLADPLHASAIGPYCDLAHLATVLRQQQERTEGALKEQVATWASALEQEVQVLRLVVPERLEQDDSEITKTEIPVPRKAVQGVGSTGGFDDR
jgi:hypothetical protein